MVIPGIYVQGYCMYECTGIQVYSITSGATALQCIALYRYTVIHQRSFCNLFCGCQLYNPILSIALQVIYSPKPSVVMSGIIGHDKCAANLATALGLQCTADFQMDNHANCSFSFPFCQRFATEGSRQYSRSVTDAMSCLSSNEATGASEMPQFAVSPSQRCDYPRKDFNVP